jgi:hypothetical protein
MAGREKQESYVYALLDPRFPGHFRYGGATYLSIVLSTWEREPQAEHGTT